MVRQPLFLKAVISFAVAICADVIAIPPEAKSRSTFFQSQLVIQKEGSSDYHRPWCPVIRDGKGVTALTRGQAEARGLKSHEACERDPSMDATTGTAEPVRRGPSAPTFVYADGSKYYHRDKCPKVVGAATRVALDAAGKKLWPCPACRPPVRKKNDAPAVPPRRR